MDILKSSCDARARVNSHDSLLVGHHDRTFRRLDHVRHAESADFRGSQSAESGVCSRPHEWAVALVEGYRGCHAEIRKEAGSGSVGDDDDVNDAHCLEGASGVSVCCGIPHARDMSGVYGVANSRSGNHARVNVRGGGSPRSSSAATLLMPPFCGLQADHRGARPAKATDSTCRCPLPVL